MVNVISDDLTIPLWEMAFSPDLATFQVILPKRDSACQERSKTGRFLNFKVGHAKMYRRRLPPLELARTANKFASWQQFSPPSSVIK